LVGTQPYRRLEQMLLALADWEPSNVRPTAVEALAAYGRGTTLEFAELLGVDSDAARRQLEMAGATPHPVGGDFAWESAGHP
jgi:hypothetical protein